MVKIGQVSAPVPDLLIHRFRTGFGLMAVIWARERYRIHVHRILLPSGLGSCVLKNSSVLQSGACPAVSELAEGIIRFLSGRPVVFDLSLLRLDLCRPFQRKVLLAESGIPRGRVSTYGRIASHLGLPRASRAVGTALARNPFPVAIPCHRALRSDLSLGGYQGGLAMKRRLLEMEGVRFGPDGRAKDPPIRY